MKIKYEDIKNLDPNAVVTYSHDDIITIIFSYKNLNIKAQADSSNEGWYSFTIKNPKVMFDKE